MVDVDITKRNTIPAPYVAQTTGRWDGDEGSWSTFALSIGTPPQSFRVLPATIDPHIAVPIPEGCMGGMSGVADCGDRRGVNNFKGVASRGFDSSSSTSWTYFNIYSEFTGQSVYNDTGPFGNDTITMLGQGQTNITIPNQVVSGVSSIDFWLGTIGLGDAPTRYSQNSFTAQSLLYNMKNQSLIPSMSYAYTAGQHYNNYAGSLVLGGYDSNRMSSNAVTTTIQPSNSTRRLNTNVDSILAQNTTGGSQTLFQEPLVASIDTSVNQLFLPQTVCDKLQQLFGLTYDAAENWYLINDTMHNINKANKASLLFALGGDSGAANILMPYTSLDLQIGVPWYNSSINYFPLRVANNPSQITLGRVFLQEAYLVVDWERNNFTIGPLNKASSSSNILAITAPAETTTSSTAASSSAPQQGSSSGGIGAGAIAGIVVAVVAIAILGGLLFWMRRRRPAHKRWSTFSFRKSVDQPPPAYNTGAEFYGSDKHEQDMAEGKPLRPEVSELHGSSEPAELTSDNVRRLEEIVQGRELMSTPVAELVGDTAGSELETTSNTARNSVTSPHRAALRKSPLSRDSVCELE